MRAQLSNQVASLRIDADQRTRLRAPRYGGRASDGFGEPPQIGLRWFPWTILALAVAAIGAWWWLTATRAVTVKTATATATTTTPPDETVLTASGYVTARRRATVSSRVTGKLTAVLVEAGMPVRVGQVLARLDDSVARAALSISDAQLDAARSDLGEIEVRLREAKAIQNRQRRLSEAGIVAVAELETVDATADALAARLTAASSTVAVAEKQLALRLVELADTTLRAPFDGIVISKDAQPGEMVSPTSAGGGFTRTGVCTIVDMSSLEIEVDVNEAHIGRISPEQPVAVVLDAYPEQRIAGHVVATVPAADRNKATVQVRIAVDQLDPQMLPDMTVKVSFLQERERDESAQDRTPRVLVPRSAVRPENGDHVVFVVRDGRAERRLLRLGSRDGDRVEIVSGLRNGDRIVVEGPPTLTDNTRVEEAPVR